MASQAKTEIEAAQALSSTPMGLRLPPSLALPAERELGRTEIHSHRVEAERASPTHSAMLYGVADRPQPVPSRVSSAKPTEVLAASAISPLLSLDYLEAPISEMSTSIPSHPEVRAETPFPDNPEDPEAVVAAMVPAQEVGKEAMAEQAALPVAYRALQAKTDKTASCSTEGPAAEAVVAAATARAAFQETAEPEAMAPTATSPSIGSLALPAPQAPPASKVPPEVRKDPRGK